MSEYQYYEFQAIDRPLTAKEQAEVKKLSSRVELTPTQAIFVYNYGDFQGNPKAVLTQYFDVMFYIANWGTWQLIFRFPKALVNLAWFEPYKLPQAIEITTTADYVILDIQIQEEEGFGWVEGEGWLPQLLPLRDDLMSGDLRLLYLVWLRTALDLAGYELEEDPVEPPIPPNLGQLSDALEAFIELVELDPDLVEVAAQASPCREASSEVSLEDQLPALSEAERQEFLLKLVRREPHVDLQLINRLKELAGVNPSSSQAVPGQRRLTEMEAIADDLQTKRQQEEQEVARKQRIKELERLAPQASATWKKVVNLIELKQAKPYDEATALLQDLRDLAEYQGKLSEFAKRLEALKSDYQSRPALIRRLETIEI